LCNADNSNINNISIKGSEAKKNNKLGVYFTDLSNFTNINSSNNIRGIYLESSTRNTLINNILNYNGDDGLLLIHSSSNNLTNNTANSNDDSGIYLYSYSSNNSVIKNAANSNGNFGIYLYFYSSNNSLNNNTVTSNNRGISLYECSNNSITNNNVSSNVYGVRLYSHTNFNYIMSNFISNNNHGITITSSDEPNFNNIIQRNKIYNNTVGLYSLNSVSIIDSNIICGNTDLDVNSSNSYGSSGSNNSCSKLQGWDDSGYIGCTYLCTPTKVISVIDKDRLSVLYNASDVEALMQDLENYSQRNAGVRYNLTQCRADFDADPTLNDAFSYRNNTNRASWNHYPGFVEGCLARIVSEQANHFNISMANISLLLVGNDNVTPFHRINVRVANWENSYETVSGNIMWSDYPYSDLDNDGDPDIPVSRLIGNAHIMSSTLENARTQYQSNSVLMAGMKSTLDQRDRQIGTEFNTTWCFNNDSIYKYFEETDDIADVRIVNLSFLERLDDGPAIIFLNSHGNDYRDLGEDMHEFSDEWDFEHYKIFLTAQNVADIGLGGGHPFVSSEQCHGGVTYPDDDTSHNMPLAFLSSEAVGYVGSTVYSPFGASDDSGYWFYQSCKDKNSIGRAHLDARQSAWACGSYYKMFAEAWTLYGDPLYEIYVPNDPASNVGYNSSTEIEGENTTLKLSILSYNISKVYTPQGDRDLVTISGAYSTTAYADNKPVIPMIINRIKLPQTRDFKEITGVTKSDVVIMEDVTLPLGCPSRQDENCYGGYSGNTLNLTEVYPNESVEYEILETVDGDRDIFFRIFPLEYNESVNRIYLYQNITFTFETKNATPKLPVQLSLTENYRDEIIAGSPTEIGIFVSNHGEAPAKNLSILEEIPAGFDVSLVSGNGTYYPATNTIVWNIDTISPWDFKMLIYKSVTYNIGDYKINTTIEYIDDYGTVYPPITVSKAIYVGGGNQIFDTGPGTYPSIPGRHNGTITPFYNLSISSIYTYPCPGTGGHTEYAALSYSNGTVIAEARWDGYIEDWHNLTFNKTFTLYANETYRYTIQTGSYPQLHQNATLLLPAGEITCTEFIDANGRIAAPRVPAIKFF
jgi:parallel beta-helix repeat protein